MLELKDISFQVNDETADKEILKKYQSEDRRPVCGNYRTKRWR